MQFCSSDHSLVFMFFCLFCVDHTKKKFDADLCWDSNGYCSVCFQNKSTVEFAKLS